jgi:hypothetical protein
MSKKDSTASSKKRKSNQLSTASGSQARSEQAAQKSAAEFFSEHQQIAGFDNVSVYWSINI